MLDQQLAKEAAIGLGLTEDEAEAAIEDFESPMMGGSNLGTYATIDCPTKKIEGALNWLLYEFTKINGVVRKISNPHDFGNYPSFEVDYPEAINAIDLDDDNTSPSGAKPSKARQIAIDEDIEKKDNWHDKANEIQGRYGKKFDQWL